MLTLALWIIFTAALPIMAVLSMALARFVQRRNVEVARYNRGLRSHLPSRSFVVQGSNVIPLRPVSFQDGRAL